MASIYKITNSVNEKVYVGKTSQTLAERFRKHLVKARRKVNRHLYDAINHYGADKFSITLIEEVAEEDANRREVFWISALDCRSPKGYNMTEGGDGGDTLKHWSEEDKRRLWTQQAEARKGFRHSEASKLLMGEMQRGKARTEEQRLHLSRVHKERGIEPPEHTKWRKGQEGTFKGRTHSVEARTAMSEFRAGKTYEDIYEDPEAERLKRSEAWKSDRNPRFKPLPTSQILQLLDMIALGASLKDIENTTGVSPFKVRQILRPFGVTNLQAARALPNWENTLKEIFNHVRGSE